MNDYKGFWNIIQMLDQINALEHIILVGSWVEYLYKYSGDLKDFYSTMRTLDMDFLVVNANKPRESINIPKEAKERGYLIDSDRGAGITRIYSTDGLELEFLILQKGSGRSPSIKTNLGVNAQALRNLDILIENSYTIDVENFKIKVPIPEAYVVQKIVVNKERGAKKDKDIEAIKNLWEHLNKEILKNVYNSLTLKQKKIYDEFINHMNFS